MERECDKIVIDNGEGMCFSMRYE